MRHVWNFAESTCRIVLLSFSLRFYTNQRFTEVKDGRIECIVLQLMAMMLQRGLSHVNGDKKCSKWSDSELRDMYINYSVDVHDYAAEFISLNLERRNKQRFAHIHENGNLESRIMNGNSQCHQNLNKASSDWMSRSLCPWYVVLTHNKDRYPSELAAAKCSCKYCYSFDGKKESRLAKIYRPRCKEIKIKHKVLIYEKSANGKLVCDPDTKKFKIQKAVEEISVGCACALRKEDKTGSGYVVKIGDD